MSYDWVSGWRKFAASPTRTWSAGPRSFACAAGVATAHRAAAQAEADGEESEDTRSLNAALSELLRPSRRDVPDGPVSIDFVLRD